MIAGQWRPTSYRKTIENMPILSAIMTMVVVDCLRHHAVVFETWVGHGTGTCATGSTLTGPNNPEIWSGSPFVQSRQLVKLKRPVGLGFSCCTHSGHDLRVPLGLQSLSSGQFSSPIRRLPH